jgi:hypothetical protein
VCPLLHFWAPHSRHSHMSLQIVCPVCAAAHWLSNKPGIVGVVRAVVDRKNGACINVTLGRVRQYKTNNKYIMNNNTYNT